MWQRRQCTRRQVEGAGGECSQLQLPACRYLPAAARVPLLACCCLPAGAALQSCWCSSAAAGMYVAAVLSIVAAAGLLLRCYQCGAAAAGLSIQHSRCSPGAADAAVIAAAATAALWWLAACRLGWRHRQILSQVVSSNGQGCDDFIEMLGGLQCCSQMPRGQLVCRSAPVCRYAHVRMCIGGQQTAQRTMRTMRMCIHHGIHTMVCTA